MTKTMFRYLRVFFFLILFFSAGMILVTLIPNEQLEPQYPKSTAQLEKEAQYPVYLFDADAAIMDNFMDGIMIRTCHVSDNYDSKIKAAFDNGYPRYWNGYLLTLRPVLTQFTYQQIRYLNMFVLLLAFAFCFSGIHQQLDPGSALGFAISITACFLVFIGESLQYFSVFIILFLTVFAILYIPRFRDPVNSALLLFVSGILTNFFDMLTAPLLTLGIPLILILALAGKDEQKNHFSGQITAILTHSVSWGAGYALCWAAKWAIGTAILGTNVFEDAFKTAKFRVEGNETFPLDRAQMFRSNFDTYFFAKGHKPAVFIGLLLILLLILLIRSHRKNWGKTFFPILLVGTFPYIWFFVFANHSQLHYFYTYRIQAITMFSVFAALGSGIDWGQFKRKEPDMKTA